MSIGADMLLAQRHLLLHGSLRVFLGGADCPPYRKPAPPAISGLSFDAPIMPIMG